MAAGKFGVVAAEGHKPRLVGDGNISGTKAASQIGEKVRLPHLENVQQSPEPPAPDEQQWVAWSWDVRGAHKLVPVRFEEQGFSCCVYNGQWYVYRCCYFGCKWAAYWFSRVGSFLLRHLHQFIYISHAAFLYVDDGVCLLPADVAPLVACCGLLFMCALGVPFSWEKMSFGQTFQSLGWCFDLTKPCAFVPQSKREKLLRQPEFGCRLDMVACMPLGIGDYMS